MMSARLDSPYRGLMPYTEADYAYFFGRAQEIATVAANLEVARLTLLYGPSGVGKTSLLRAGVLYQLQQQAQANFTALGRAEIIPIYFNRWQQEPLLGLTQTIQQTIEPYTKTNGDTLAATQNLPLFPTLLRQASTQTQSDLLIILDQFEEYFLYADPFDLANVADALVQAINSPDLRANFLLSLREDALARLDLFKGRIPFLLDNRLSIERLSRDAARDAIEKPLIQYSQEHNHIVTIESSLTETILDQLCEEQMILLHSGTDMASRNNQQIETPYLQLVLTRLWNEEQLQGSTVLRTTTLDILGNTSKIVANYLNENMALLSKQEQDLAARCFDRLVTPSGTKVALTIVDFMRYTGANQITVEKLLQTLLRLRILQIAPVPRGENRYEITHDVLGQAILTWQERYKASQIILRTQHILIRQLVIVGVIVLAVAVFLATRSLALVDEAERIESRKVAIDAIQQLTNDPMAALGTALTRLPTRTNPLPMIPELQAAVVKALHTPLETTYQDLSTLLVTGDMLTDAQIQLGRNWLAVAGTEVALLNLTSGERVTLTTSSEPFVAVQWDQTGTKLLGWNAHQISVWQEEKLLASQSFGDKTNNENINCVQWRPTAAEKNEVAICTDITIRLWSPSEQTLSKLTALPLSIAGLSWSPDGRWLVAWDDSRAAKAEAQSIFIWDSQQQYRLITTTTDGANPIQSVVWSPTSHGFIAPQLRKGALRWSAEVVTEVVPIPHTGKIDGVAFVDEEHFLSWAIKDVTRLWSMDGEQQMQYGIAEDRVQGIALVPQQREFLTFIWNGSAYQWNIDYGERTHTFCCHDKPIRSASWHDDNYLATAGKDGTVRIWPVDPFESTGKELLTLHVSKANNTSGRTDVLGVLWLNGHDLLTYGQDAKLRRWQIFDEHDQPICSGIDARKLPICHHFSQTIPDIQGNLSQLQWVNDETLVIASAAGANIVTIANSRAETKSFTASTSSLPVWSLDGRYLLHTTDAQSAQVKEIKSEQTIMTFSQPISTVLALEDGFLISGVDDQVTLLQPGKNQATLLQGALYPITAAALAQDGRLATANEWSIIQIWSLPEGREQMRLGDKLGFVEQLPIYELRWSADGKSLFSVNRIVMRWNLSNQAGVRLLQDAGFKAHIDLSKDERLLAVAIGTRFFVVDAKANGEGLLWANHEHDQSVMGVRWVEAAQWPNQYRYGAWLSRLGSWLTGREINTEASYTLLMTWSSDGTVRLWDWQSQTEAMRFSEPGPILTAAINPSGSQIAAISLSPTGEPAPLRIWQTWLNDPISLVETARSRLIVDSH